jgi:hypothetical protein
MLTLEGPLVLLTCFGSLVSQDTSNNLIHRHDYASFPNFVLFCRDGRLLVGDRAFAPDACSITQNSVDEWHLEWQPAADAVSIRTPSGYLCAEPDGVVSASREHAATWERFELVPLQEAQERLRPTGTISPPRFREASSISKLVHQTYRTERLPYFLKENVERLKERLGSYRYVFWNEKDQYDFLYENYGFDLLQEYLRISPSYGAARADLFRYLCLYKLGGVYLDIKSNIDRPLEQIILPDDRYILSQWDNGPSGRQRGFGLHEELANVPGGEYEQWHVISAPGHPFLLAVINKVLRNIHDYVSDRDGTGKKGVLCLTGPIAYTQAIHEIRAQHPHRFLIAEKSGFTYNAVAGYHLASPRHYSRLTTPIVNV